MILSFSVFLPTETEFQTIEKNLLNNALMGLYEIRL